MTTDIEGLKALLEKATPGPWKVADKVATVGGDRYLVITHPAGWVSLIMEGDDGRDEADAVLIVAAVNALPDLLATITALEDKLAGCVEALEEIATYPGPNADDAAHNKADFARAALSNLQGEKE
jgi:hypothetical protein